MPKSWLFPGFLLVALAVAAFGQQAEGERTDQERIIQLEKQVADMQRALVSLSGDGTVGMTPASLELRLGRIEMRLDRLEQQFVRSSGGAGASSDRMLESRMRSLENAVMRLQQQR